jgi:hypothetical protein
MAQKVFLILMPDILNLLSGYAFKHDQQPFMLNNVKYLISFRVVKK